MAEKLKNIMNPIFNLPISTQDLRKPATNKQRLGVSKDSLFFCEQWKEIS